MSKKSPQYFNNDCKDYGNTDQPPTRPDRGHLPKTKIQMTPQNSFTSSSGDNTYSRSQSSDSSPRKLKTFTPRPPPVPKPRTSIQAGSRRRCYERSKSVDLDHSDNSANFSVYGNEEQDFNYRRTMDSRTMNSRTMDSRTMDNRPHYHGAPQPTPRKSVQKRIELSSNELFNNPKMQVYPPDILFRRNSSEFVVGNMHRKYKAIVTEPVTLSPPMREGQLDEVNSAQAKLSRQSSYAKMSNSGSCSRSSVMTSRQNTLVSSEGSFKQKRPFYRQRSLTSNEDNQSTRSSSITRSKASTDYQFELQSNVLGNVNYHSQTVNGGRYTKPMEICPWDHDHTFEICPWEMPNQQISRAYSNSTPGGDSHDTITIQNTSVKDAQGMIQPHNPIPPNPKARISAYDGPYSPVNKQKARLSIHTPMTPGLSNTSSTIIIQQNSVDLEEKSDQDSRPSSIRNTISPHEDDINVHKRHPRQFNKQQIMSRPGSRWNTTLLPDTSMSRISRLAMNSEFETDSSLSYNCTPNVIKLKLAIRVKPAPQEYSIRSGLPGAAPQIKPAELEVYVEAAKNIPLVNEKCPSTYVRASVHHPKYG